MRYAYRAEPGRLILALTELDVGDRLPVDQARFLTVDLGRSRVQLPAALDWDLAGAFAPVRVVADPLRRVWEVVTFTDHGDAVELSTPTPTDS